MSDHSLRRRFQIELLLLLVLTPLFLLIMPHRMSVFAPAALIFLVYVLIDAHFTQPRIWQQRTPEPGDLKKALQGTALITLPPFFIMLGLGIYLDHHILVPNLLQGMALYLFWALVQQALFQVYLLGRLHVLFPRISNTGLAAMNGLAYALVHLPYLWVTLGTLPLGIIWTLLFIRYRKLWPLALSHAMLATAFYYWVMNRDLIAELGL
jgi:membrane protease YdiL (CAAX protease family)